MTTLEDDARRLSEELDAQIAVLEALTAGSHKLLLKTNPPPNAIALVKEAVQDPEVTRFNFREWIASKLPNFFCGPSKAQVMEVFSLAFGALVAWNAAQMDLRDPNDFATCSANSTWPPDCWPNCPEPSAPEIQPYPEFSPLLAQPKGTSVVDQVFAKEAEARHAEWMERHAHGAP